MPAARVVALAQSRVDGVDLYNGRYAADGVGAIADLAGTTLYTVSRTLTTWESLGIIESRKRLLLLRSPEQLQHVGGADED
jgi:hypothetical protein